MQYHQCKKPGASDGVTSYQLRTFAALIQDTGFVPSTHIRQLTTIYNSSSAAFYWPPQTPTHMLCV